MKIAATVTTYNRLELLKKVIKALKSQSRKLDYILVVNNNSDDGTREWLEQQEGISIINQENSGSSGGQFSGMKKCFEEGYDKIWVMDDDVLPANDSLENLLKYPDKEILCTLRYKNNGEVFINDVIELNMENPFKSIWKKVINYENLNDDIIKVEGATFEGPLIDRKVMERIGFAEKKFFIMADDTEYFVKAKKAGIAVYIITKARMDRMLPTPDNFHKFTWKHYYLIRNLIAIDRMHGKFLVKNFRPIGYLITWLGRCKNMNDIKTTFTAFFDGYFYKSSN